MQDGKQPDNSNYVPALDDTMGTVWQRMRDDAGFLDETARDGFGGFFSRGVENSVSSDGTGFEEPLLRRSINTSPGSPVLHAPSAISWKTCLALSLPTILMQGKLSRGLHRLVLNCSHYPFSQIQGFLTIIRNT